MPWGINGRRGKERERERSIFRGFPFSPPLFLFFFFGGGGKGRERGKEKCPMDPVRAKRKVDSSLPPSSFPLRNPLFLPPPPPPSPKFDLPRRRRNGGKM